MGQEGRKEREEREGGRGGGGLGAFGEGIGPGGGTRFSFFFLGGGRGGRSRRGGGEKHLKVAHVGLLVGGRGGGVRLRHRWWVWFCRRREEKEGWVGTFPPSPLPCIK